MSKKTPRVSFPSKEIVSTSTGDGIKILFLDFDGVINTYRGYRWFNQERSLRKTLINFFEFLLRNRLTRNTSKFLKDYSKFTYRPHRGFVNSIPGFVSRIYHRLFWKYLANDEGFDDYAIHWVIKLLEDHPDLRIVVSSIWRLNGIKNLRRLLHSHGIDKNRVLSSTPRVHHYRGKEVKAWLDGLERNPNLLFFKEYDVKDDQDFANLQHSYHKKVTSFAIVDDDSDLHPFYKRFVRVNGHDGIDHAAYKKLNHILNRPLRSKYE